MAIIAGHQGAAAVTGGQAFAEFVASGNIISWEATIENEVFDAGVFGAQTNTMPLYRGMYKIRGTVTGYFPNDQGVTASWVAVGASSSANLTLTHASGKTYAGPALIEFSFTEPRTGGLVQFQATFESDGDWSFA